ESRFAGGADGFDVLGGRHCPASRRAGEQDAPSLWTGLRLLRDAWALGPLESNQEPVHLADTLARLQGEQFPRKRIQLGCRGSDGQGGRPALLLALRDLDFILRPATVLDEATEQLAQALYQRRIPARLPYRLQVGEHRRRPVPARAGRVAAGCG